MERVLSEQTQVILRFVVSFESSDVFVVVIWSLILTNIIGAVSLCFGMLVPVVQTVGGLEQTSLLIRGILVNLVVVSLAIVTGTLVSVS